MTKSRILFILSGLVVVLLSANLALAKGVWGKVEISGAGISGVAEITDQKLLDAFAMHIFQDLEQDSIDPPEIIGGGYKMLRGWDDVYGHFDPFDKIYYYRDPAGGSGYLYYDGLVNGSSEYDHHWYRVTATGEAAMREVFADQGVTIDTAALVPALVLHGHTSRVNILRWSPDGKILASAAGEWASTDFDVWLWDADGSPIAKLVGHHKPVQVVVWSPDGTMLATGAQDGTIRLWGADGHLINTIEVDERQVHELSWSPDNQSLVSVSMDDKGVDTIQHWSLDGSLLDSMTSTTGSIFLRVAWTTDDEYILTSGLGYHEPNADGHIVFTPRSCNSCTPYWGYTWSPRNQMWAIGNESGNVSVYRADGSWIDDLHNEGNVDTIEWSPDGKLLAGGNTIWAWDGLEFHRQAGISTGRVASLTWSPDGAQLASVASNFSDIRLWDTSGQPMNILQGHSGSVEMLSWSPDGAQLASGGADYTVRLWDMASLRQD